MLLIGRSPDFINLSFIQKGDSLIFIESIDIPEYLLQSLSLILTVKFPSFIKFFPETPNHL